MHIKIDKSLCAVEAMLGRKLNNGEMWLYHTTKNDHRYQYIVRSDGTLDARFSELPPVEHVIYQGENGFLEAHHIRTITESAEYATVKGATTDLVYYPETADIRGEIESR